MNEVAQQTVQPGCCKHWEYNFITRAYKLLSYCRNRIDDNAICLHCGEQGKLLDKFGKFRNHLLTTGHYLCIHFVSPIELYCFVCNDFQYSTTFDMLIGKKRRSTYQCQEVEIESPVIRGICNMGSTCFMSSVLQVILHNNCFEKSTTWLDNWKNCSKEADLECPNSLTSPSTGCIACEIKRLIHATRANDSDGPRVLIPSELLFCVWSWEEGLAGYAQQDAHEFFMVLMDGLDTHLKDYHSGSGSGSGLHGRASSASPHTSEQSSDSCGASSTTSSFSASLPSSSSSSSSQSTVCLPSSAAIIQECFRGHLMSDVVCLSCGGHSRTTDPALDISLSLGNMCPGLGNSSSSSELSCQLASKSAGQTIYDCLRLFTSVELLSEAVYCESCRGHHRASKQFSLLHTPAVLVLHLKRFDAVTQAKLDTPVSFPLLGLDLSPFLSSGTGTSMPLKQLPQLYDLQGLVVHKGSLNQGHYISYVAQQDKWYRCDDEKVCEVSHTEVEMAQGYLLFYAKRA